MGILKLSHSAKDVWKTCKYKWHLHYQKRYRSVRVSSALAFGSSFDLALNNLLETKDIILASEVFYNSWEEWKYKPLIDFYKSDYNPKLLSGIDEQEILSEDEDLKEHLENWYSLRAKGLRMLAEYDLHIMPSLAEIISIQGEFEIPIPNTEHTVGGKLDLIARIGEHTYILDNKTTSQPYAKNSCLTKEQTALYARGMPEYDSNVGFLTINKKDFRTQILLGKAPEELQESVMQDFVSMATEIDSTTEFDKNKKGCYSFGSKCQFYSHCWGDGFNENIYEAEKE